MRLDVFLARSDGKSHFHRPTPTQLKAEMVARAEQQVIEPIVFEGFFQSELIFL